MSEPKIQGVGPIDLVTEKDKKRLQKLKDIKDRDENDIRSLMSTAGNRRVINRHLAFCGCFENPYVADEAGYQTTYNVGLKAGGLRLMNQILSVCPELFIQMQAEARADRIQQEKEINKGD